MHKFRIAQVTEFYYPHLGGICEHVHHLAREARTRGHHVDIITSRIDGTESPGVIRFGQSVPVYSNGSLARITVGRSLRRQMREVLAAGRYDIVHVHAPLTPTLPLLAVEEARCPVVGTFHADLGYSMAYTLGGRFFRRRMSRLAAAVAVSPTVINGHGRYFQADWRVIPNGVDVDFFTPDAPRPPCIRPDVPSVLFLGRFDPRNGLGMLIDAFRKVRSRRRPAQLVVVGDGPLRGYYRRLAKGDHDVIFVGAARFEDRPPYYANAAVYACPTTTGSFGITLLESMACGTAIVCSEIDGFSHVVTHGRQAIMFPVGSVRGLADALVQVLDDDALRERLGAAGRQRALDFAWPQVTESVLHLYADVLGEQRIAS
ncbi:MAG TPA: glycosyltransferase family 4 protein [Gemmatimonadaceae bacterium]|jgi:phosphatidylinositol alpha-mannosyltransferase|nr:glycosyltransferase family 4 protein [Gemmatimonadaceae bacterium]